MEYRRADVIFTQGDPCEHVLYIQKGNVKLSVLSKAGREAVVAMLGPGEFFGEGCLAGQSVRMGSATATTESTILLVDKDRMVRLLHKQHALSDRFIAHMLARNIRTTDTTVPSSSGDDIQRRASERHASSERAHPGPSKRVPERCVRVYVQPDSLSTDIDS